VQSRPCYASTVHKAILILERQREKASKHKLHRRPIGFLTNGFSDRPLFRRLSREITVSSLRQQIPPSSYCEQLRPLGHAMPSALLGS